MSFSIKKDKKDDKDLLSIQGAIDEEAEFPNYELSGEVFVDLGQVSSINSIGIRAWVLWFGQFKDKVHFSFFNVPKSVTMQMNMVEGFLPPQSSILSLYVPFYCESCDEEKEMLFEVGKQISIEGDSVKIDYEASKICKPDCEPELDVVESKFFRFLTLDDAKKAA